MPDTVWTSPAGPEREVNSLPPLASPVPIFAAPSLGLMHATFVLAGLGTLLLGPILPLLSAEWHLPDSGSGLLLFAQFLGATVGGSTVSSRLQRGLMIGLAAATAGLAAFAASRGLWSACPSLCVAGFGIGRVIATVNIVAGQRYTQQRGSVLARLNFTWSFGALLSPLLASLLAPRFRLSHLLGGFAALFAAAAIAFGVEVARDRALTRSRGQKSSAVEAPAAAPASLSWGVFVYFCLLLVLYGGLETCLSGWLTTYALRYGGTTFVLSAYTLTLLLLGLTVGRALASLLLRRLREWTLIRWSLALATVLAVAIAATHAAWLLAVLAVALGMALAPVFPSVFAVMLGYRPSARQAGVVLAASGIGASILPALMGLVSTRAGSLRLALVLPLGAALAMLFASLRPPRSSFREDAR